MNNQKNQNIPDAPLVSVSIITYNHKDFIVKAIESVLMQKVDFKYEIIIGDDFSKDGTQEILKEYQAKYPDIIQLILHPRDYDDIPGRINNTTNIYACRGKYIALLDGDDEWVSPDKLQVQIDFMEANPDFALTFHESLFCYPDSEEALYSPMVHIFKDGKTVLQYDDVIMGYFIQTSTMIFRNNLIGEFPDWFWEIYSADYAIQLLVIQHGKAKYFPKLLGKRNFHDKSFSATQNTTTAHRELKEREVAILGKHFPGFKQYRRYRLVKQTFKEAKQHLRDFRLKHFFGKLGSSAKYSGQFLFDPKIALSKKISWLKGTIQRRLEQ